MSLQIRRADSSDYASLLPLFDQIDLLHREALPEIFVKPEGSPREKDYFEDLLQQPQVGFFIAQEQDQMIGFVHAAVRNAPPLAIFAPRRYAVVEGAVVSKDYQGRGIGRKLMQRVHEWALEKGAGSVELNVYNFNAGAISFYERLGYEPLSLKLRKPLLMDDKDRAG